MKHAPILTLLSLVGLLLVSCSKTESDNVKTSGFYVTYSVQGNNQNSVSCTATFQVGGSTGTYLDLSSGDTITCNGNSMSRSEFLGMITYTATVPYSVGGTYTLVLSRTGESAYSSSVVLPEAIAGMNPSSATSYTKGTGLSAAWTPSSNAADGMNVYLRYTAAGTGYYYSQNDTSPENGVVGFSSAETQLQPPVAGTWSGSIEYSRTRAGTMATELSGTITAYQEVTVSISLVD